MDIFFSASPLDSSVEYIKSAFKSGRIAVSDGGDYAKKLLAEGFVVDAFSPEDKELREDVKYVAAAGGWEVIDSAKRLAGGRPLVIAPDAPYRWCFNDAVSSGNYRTDIPLAAFFPENESELGRKIRVSSALGGLADAIDLIAAGHSEIYAARAKFFGAVSGSYRPSVAGIASGEELLAKSGLKGGGRLAEAVDSGTGNPAVFDFFTRYLSHYLLLRFTNGNFNDILIDTDRVRLRRVAKLSGAPLPSAEKAPFIDDSEARKAVLSRENLRAAARLFGGAYSGDVIKASLDALLISSEKEESDGLISEILRYIDGIRAAEED
jgi:hypothetical protein